MLPKEVRYRIAYSFHLEWEEMEDLVTSSPDVWIKFKVEVSAFMRSFQEKISILS